MTIPEDQSAAASSACGWDPAAPIAYSTTTDGNLTFHNACALLKVTHNAGGVVRILVTAKSTNPPYSNTNPYNGPLSGVYDLNTSNGTFSKESIEDTETGVEVKGVPNGKTIYIAIVPGTKEVFSAWCDPNNSDQLRTRSKDNVTFEAGKIYDLGNTSSWPTLY